MLKPDIIEALQRLVGTANVLTEPEEKLVYECDGLTMFKATPEVVVFPTSTPQVAEVVGLANQAQIPFVARGGGTGLSGGALAVEGGMMIALTKLNRILEIDLDNQRAVVQPGVVNLWITQAVSAQGYYFAPDPSSQQACTIGGNVAENSGGPHTLKYGVTTNHVLGLEVVLPDGQIIDTGGPAEDYPGYDLTGTLVGSEGTLGIVTKIIVRLMRKTEAVKTLMAVFESMDDASNTVSDVIGQGIVPAAIEMMDQLALQAVEAYIHAGYPTDAGGVLLIELDGLRDGMEEIAAQIATSLVNTMLVKCASPAMTASVSCSGSVANGPSAPWGGSAPVTTSRTVSSRAHDCRKCYGTSATSPHAMAYVSPTCSTPAMVICTPCSCSMNATPTSANECCRPVKRFSASAPPWEGVSVASMASASRSGKICHWSSLSWIWPLCRKCGRCSTPRISVIPARSSRHPGAVSNSARRSPKRSSTACGSSAFRPAV